MLVYIEIGDRSQNHQTAKLKSPNVQIYSNIILCSMVPLKDNIIFAFFLLATLEHKERLLKHLNLYKLPHVAQLTCTLHASWMRMICLWAVLYLCIYMHTGVIPYIAQNVVVGENFYEFSKTNIICQYCIQPNSRFGKLVYISGIVNSPIFLSPKLWNDIV